MSSCPIGGASTHTPTPDNCALFDLEAMTMSAEQIHALADAVAVWRIQEVIIASVIDSYSCN